MQYLKSFLATMLLIAVAMSLTGCLGDERAHDARIQEVDYPVVVAGQSNSDVTIDEIYVDRRAAIRMIDHRYKQYCLRNKSGSNRNWSCSPLQE